MIPFKNRFHGHSSLNYVYKNGQAFRSRSIIFKTIANTKRKDSRIAVVVGKKVLKSSVSRNRVRRRIYELIRLKLPYFDGVYDIVAIVSSSDLLTVSFGDLSEQLTQLFNQANIQKLE